MTSIPPLLPDQVLARVLRIARADGLSIALVSGIFALLAAASRDFAGAFIGLLVAGAGAMELHGVGQLRGGRSQGMNLLVGAQLFLLATLWSYCAWKLTHPDLEQMRAAFHRAMEFPGMRQKWAEAERVGITEDEYLRLLYGLTYGTLAVATGIYQGGMALYYRRRRKTVTLALETE